LDRRSGKPIANAIIWQDRRTAEICAQLRLDGREGEVQNRTGLLIDPYFSERKSPGCWIARAEAGELAFGTIDAFLLWRLKGGQAHVTDATNASRAMPIQPHTTGLGRRFIVDVRNTARAFT
jgi:glycerol kinase